MPLPCRVDRGGCSGLPCDLPMAHIEYCPSPNSVLRDRDRDRDRDRGAPICSLTLRLSEGAQHVWWHLDDILLKTSPGRTACKNATICKWDYCDEVRSKGSTGRDRFLGSVAGTYIGVARPITYAALTGARGYRVGRMARGASGEQDSEYSIPRKHAGEHIRKHFWALELCRLPFHGHDKRELHGDGQHCGVGQHNLVCTWKFCARHADGHAGDRLFCWSVREQWACSIHG